MAPAWNDAVACAAAPPDQIAAAAASASPAATVPPPRRGPTGLPPATVESLTQSISHPLDRAGAIDARAQFRLAAVTHGARTGKPDIELFARHHFDAAHAADLDIH